MNFFFLQSNKLLVLLRSAAVNSNAEKVSDRPNLLTGTAGRQHAALAGLMRVNNALSPSPLSLGQCESFNTLDGTLTVQRLFTMKRVSIKTA